MSFNFACDAILYNKAYPALAKWQAQPYTKDWQQFVHHWPYTVPCELHEHCAEHHFSHTINNIAESKPGSFYTVGLGFFDFNIDYFALIPRKVFEQGLIVLFYYHEGDNPYKIKKRLTKLCLQHHLPTNCYRFVSGNTAADHIPGFVYFPDHELLYWCRNKNVNPTLMHSNQRNKDFTVLSRTHKWWRATAVADLYRKNLLKNSYWSYNTQISINDQLEDNPIEIDTLGIRDYLFDFLNSGPYQCDTMTDNEHNDHAMVETAHYTNSYCNIILETHFDADQSSGTFLTEKTFKVLKHGQPFVIVGPANSLGTLRDLGYRTFDHAIDNSYDLEPDNTRRWLKIVNAIQQIKQQDMKLWFMRCWDDVQHNQQLFSASKHDRLNTLYDKLLH